MATSAEYRAVSLRAAAYWVATAGIVAEMGVGGVWDVARLPFVCDVVLHLGYPSYFLVLLGTWKVLGAIAIVVPGRRLRKEWAYAGAFFNYSGAIVSHLTTGYDTVEVAILAPMLVLTVTSWALRPASRRLAYGSLAAGEFAEQLPGTQPCLLAEEVRLSGDHLGGTGVEVVPDGRGHGLLIAERYQIGCPGRARQCGHALIGRDPVIESCRGDRGRPGRCHVKGDHGGDEDRDARCGTTRSRRGFGNRRHDVLSEYLRSDEQRQRAVGQFAGRPQRLRAHRGDENGNRGRGTGHRGRYRRHRGQDLTVEVGGPVGEQ
jgi:hypothetical protein